MKLLDLFCGAGGWTRAAQARGWECVGYDIEDLGYPAQLIIKALPVLVEELDSHRPDLIVASPPCEAFARYALPWFPNEPSPDTKLLEWAIGLIGRTQAPVIVECNRQAGLMVPGGRAVGRHASWTMWGAIPALMPYDIIKDAANCPGKGKARAARRALIPAELAEWLFEFHESKVL